jgi:CBS domain containing-hemolysin-like protein
MLLWVAVLCVIVTMFFSAVEMAFIAANRRRLRALAEDGHRVAAEYLEAFRHPRSLLGTAMMGVTIAHIVAASAVTSSLLPELDALAPLVATAAVTPVMLVFGEVIPKAIAREWATTLILVLYRPLRLASTVLAPLVGLAHVIVSMLLRLVGSPQADVRQFVSREELKALLQLEPGEADVTTQEAELIDKIFGFGDRIVREIMVPLVEVAMLPATAPPGDAIRLIHQRGFSRIPIFARRETLAELARPPYFVPETKRIDDLLREMQRRRTHLAVVVDEYGGATGVVTLEDVLEQIVGEIQDEHDRTPASVDRLPDGSYWVSARAGIDELNEALDWNLPHGDFETVGGLVLASLHRIPRTGEEFTIPGYTITVLEADVRHVVAVKITPGGPGAPDTSTA